MELTAPPGFGKTFLLRRAFRTAPFFASTDWTPQELAGALPPRTTVIVDAIDRRPELIPTLRRWQAKSRASVVVSSWRPILAEHGVVAQRYPLPPLALPHAGSPGGFGAEALELLLDAAGLQKEDLAPPEQEDAIVIARLSGGVPAVVEMLAARARVWPLAAVRRRGLAPLRPRLAELFEPFLKAVGLHGLLERLAPVAGALDARLLETLGADDDAIEELLRTSIAEPLNRRDGTPLFRISPPIRAAVRPRAADTARFRRWLEAEAAAAIGPDGIGPLGEVRASLVGWEEDLEAAVEAGGEAISELAICRASLVAVGAATTGPWREALDRAAEGEGELAPRALIARGDVRYFEGSSRSAAKDYRRAKRHARGSVRTLAAIRLATLAGDSGDASAARRLLADARRSTRDPWLHALGAGIEGRLTRTEGRFAAGEACFAEQRRLAVRAGDRWLVATADANRAACLEDLGRMEEALRRYRAALRLMGRVDPHWKRILEGYYGALWLELGDPRNAEAALRRSLSGRTQSRRFTLLFSLFRAAALFELGDVLPAEALVQEVEAAALGRRDFEPDPIIVRAIELVQRLASDAVSEADLRGPEDLTPILACLARRGGAAPKVVVDRGGTWFRTPSGARIDLARRPVLVRIVRVLARGEPLSRCELAARVWPAEPWSKTLDARLRKAISLLRGLGLTGIETAGGAYALEARISR